MIVLTMLRSLAGKLWSYAPVRYAFLVAGALAAGYIAGRYAQPAKVVTKTEIQTQTEYVDRVVERVVTRTVRAEERRAHVVVTERTTKTPDGTVTTERTATRDTGSNTSVVTKNDDTKSNTTAVTERATERSVSTVAHPSDWRISALGGVLLTRPSVGGLQAIPLFGLSAERRIVGPLFVGVGGMVARDGRQGYVGVSIGAQF